MAATIGRYRIVTELGRGGMATVYLAIDAETNESVAVKLMARDLTQEASFRRRFRREVDALRRLKHPSILAFLDFGEHGEQPYLVMPCMSGGTLEDRLQAGALPPATIAAILTPIADALDYAHSQGVIHRDVKPSNILFDESRHPYLTDFGIVKTLDELNSVITQSGALLGTPAYMSPEQVKGGDITGSCDIYALGIVLFQMLTGQLPFTATDPFAQAFQRVHEPVPVARAINAALAPEWQPIIDRALAKDPPNRYATAGEMAADVRQVVAPAVETPPAPTVVRPNRRLWPSVGAAALVLLALGSAIWWGVDGGLIDPRGQPTLAPTAALVVVVPTSTIPAAATREPLSETAESATSATAVETTVATASPYTSLPTRFRLANSVELRAGPGMVYEIVTTLPAGEEVTVIGRDAVWAWYNVRRDSDGQTGWLAHTSGQLVDAGRMAAIAEAGTIPAPPVTVTSTTLPVVAQPTQAVARATAALATAAPASVVITVPPPTVAVPSNENPGNNDDPTRDVYPPPYP